MIADCFKSQMVFIREKRNERKVRNLHFWKQSHRFCSFFSLPKKVIGDFKVSNLKIQSSNGIYQRKEKRGKSETSILL